MENTTSLPDGKKDFWEYRKLGKVRLPDSEIILDPVKPHEKISPEDLQSQKETIEQTLHYNNILSSVVDIQCGPAFTRFRVEPFSYRQQNGSKTRVSVSRIESLKQDLRQSLSVSQLSIEVPDSAQTYSNIQILNKPRYPVCLREVIESSEFKSNRYELGIALGKDVNSVSFGADLSRMHHLLVAGAVGSGVYACLNTILASLLLYHTPDQLKLVLTDMRHMGLSDYNRIPHLITPVISDSEQAANLLHWVQRESDLRNQRFEENNVSDIQEYNHLFPENKLSYIVVVLYDLAKLMMEMGAEIEESIVRLSQTAHTMGIHLIVATHYTVTDVITDEIRESFPTKIAFTVAAGRDSRMILGRSGAEDLFGRGDMYFVSPEEPELKRLQNVCVTNEEIERIVCYWRRNDSVDSLEEEQDSNRGSFLQSFPENNNHDAETFSLKVPKKLPNTRKLPSSSERDGDVLYAYAVETVQRAGRVSANLLVANLCIGYNRANKLMAKMEADGIISPPNDNPAIPRKILDYGKFCPKNDEKRD